MINKWLPELDRYIKLRPILRIYRSIFRTLLSRKHIQLASAPVAKPALRVLVVGAYLANRRNTAAHLCERFQNCRNIVVTQAWASIDGTSNHEGLRAATRLNVKSGNPKFPLMNRLLALFDLADFDFVVVTDDDIVVPHGFLDAFILAQHRYQLALAQPARTATSCGSKRITIAQPGILARETRFVEIGPLFSVATSLFNNILPFDETNAMGWGCDYHWPIIVANKGLKMGIVDATPVDHSIRALASAYSGHAAAENMRAYFASHTHLTPSESEITVRTHLK